MSADPQPTAAAPFGAARADDAAREGSAFQRAILECADYSIISTAPDGVIRTFNRAAERMLGYRAEEVVGKTTPEIIHDREEVTKRAAALTAELGRPVLAGFETFVAKARLGLADEQEWNYLRKDGARVPVQLSVTAMRDEAGQIIGFLGIAHDITHRKAAQARVNQLTLALEQRVQARTAELVSSQQRYETLATVAPVGIYHCDLAGLCSFVNQRWCDITGYQLKDALGEGWGRAVHPEDRVRVLEEWSQAVREQRPFQLEYRYRTPAGADVWVFGQAAAERDLAGRVVSYVGTVTDITEFKLAQMALQASGQRFQLVVEASPNGLLMVNRAGRIVLVNAQTERLFGYTREELAGQPVDLLVPDGVRPGHAAQRASFCAASGARPMGAGRDLFARRKDGTEFPVEIGLNPIQTEEGLMVLGTIVDISQRKRAELVTATLAELGRQLGAANSRQAAARVILAAVDRLFAFDAMLLHLLSEDCRHVFRVLMLDTVDGKRIEQPGNEIALEPSAMFQRVATQGAQLILREAAAPVDVPLEPFGNAGHVSASLMFVPVRAGGRVIGVLSVQSYRPSAFDAENLKLLQSLADYAGTGLARVGAHDESERLARLLLETQRVAHLGSFEGNLLTGTDHWSDETFRQMGYAPGEVAASLPNFLARVHPADRERVARGVEQIMRDGRSYQSEYRVVRPDGTVRHIHSAAAAEVNAAGRVVRVFGAAQDVTHQKQIEAELRQSQAELERRVEERTAELGRTNVLLFSEVEERKAIEAALRDSQTRLRTIIDSTPDWIFIKDQEHRYRMVNEGYARAYRRRPEDFFGKNDLDLGTPPELVMGNPAKGIRGYWADDREVMDTGQLKVISEEPGMADGEPVFLSTVKVPLRDATGKVTGVLGYVRDITERKAMEAELRNREEQLRDLFENATDLIQSIAPDGRILFVNRAWLNTLGYRVSELAALNIFDIIHPDCLGECREHFTRVLRGEALTSFQAMFRARDGRKIHVEGNASCRFENGQPVATRGIFRDISKRKAIEEERERLITELQAALAEVKTLSGLLPVCGWCKKIRDDSGYWNSVEGYLKKSSGMDITHGICPECSAKMMADVDKFAGASEDGPSTS